MAEQHTPQHTVSAAVLEAYSIHLDNVARICATDVVCHANLCGTDRDTVLRAVIKRLEDAIGR